MTEQIASVWDAISQFLTNKAISVFAALGVSVGAETMKKDPSINLADYVFFSIDVPTWLQLMASFWIFTLIIEKYGFFKLVKWLWQKAASYARKD
jgi:hypothetical protein